MPEAVPYLEPSGRTLGAGITTLPVTCKKCGRVSVTADPIGRGWLLNPKTGVVWCVSCVNRELDF